MHAPPSMQSLVRLQLQASAPIRPPWFRPGPCPGGAGGVHEAPAYSWPGALPAVAQQFMPPPPPYTKPPLPARPPAPALLPASPCRGAPGAAAAQLLQPPLWQQAAAAEAAALPPAASADDLALPADQGRNSSPAGGSELPAQPPAQVPAQPPHPPAAAAAAALALLRGRSGAVPGGTEASAGLPSVSVSFEAAAGGRPRRHTAGQ
jgi:hypothetical protein